MDFLEQMALDLNDAQIARWEDLGEPDDFYNDPTEKQISETIFLFWSHSKIVV